ncbi:MAG: leucine-rich repeat protein [Rikenellaceae bacterium]
MKKLIYPLLLTLPLFVGCEKSNNTTTPTPNEEEKTIFVTINGSNETTTKVSYEPNSDNSTYKFRWEEDDAFSLIVPSTLNNNQKFSTDTASESSEFSGEIITWSGEKDIYAIYPYTTTGYTLDSSNSTIEVSLTTQILNASDDSDYSNGLMIALASDATASSDGGYNIPDLQFKQAMSFFQLELENIPTDETLIELGFESDTEIFYSSATIDLNTIAIDNSNSTLSTNISASISNQAYTTAMLNMAIAPVDLSGEKFTLYITTKDGDGNKTKYIKEFENGINFTRNTFYFSNSGALDLTQDFTIEDGNQTLSLSDFDGSFVPSGDVWTIDDVEGSTKDFANIQSAINNADRDISLIFPNLESVPNNAFSNDEICCQNLIGFSAPLAIGIGESAFENCNRLTNISFPNAENIADMAFINCSYFTPDKQEITGLKNVDFPNVVTIGVKSFSNCSDLSSISFPNVETIGGGAFIGCNSLVDVSFPLVNKIGLYSFYTCSNLTTISFPKATNIRAGAFVMCTNLVNVSLPEATTLGCDEQCGPFCDCYNLTNIYLPKVDTISHASFYNCTNLNTISVPLAKIIDSRAFDNCEKLITITAPNVEYIEYSAFNNCKSLSSISFPLVQFIGNNAFAGCYSLETATFPAVTFIEEDAFVGCYSLETATFPSATSIENLAFEGCDALTSLEIASNDGSVIEYLGDDLFFLSNIVSQESKITLTTGVDNKDMIYGNTLTIDRATKSSTDEVSYTFKNIILKGGSEGYLNAEAEDANGIGW